MPGSNGDGGGRHGAIVARRERGGTLPVMEIPASIEVRERTAVVIGWPDGSTTTLSARQLRGGCQCATCREPSGIAATASVLGGHQPIEIVEAALVGNYAINFVFTPDHHGTGIFPFDLLRTLGDGSAADEPPA